jgi:hypothetical protein
MDLLSPTRQLLLSNVRVGGDPVTTAIYPSPEPRLLANSLQRPSKRQLVAIGIGHVEIAFTPGPIRATLTKALPIMSR